jgi:hypothetical protein
MKFTFGFIFGFICSFIIISNYVMNTRTVDTTAAADFIHNTQLYDPNWVWYNGQWYQNQGEWIEEKQAWMENGN